MQANLFFCNSFMYRGVAVYSNEAINPNIRNVIDDAVTRLHNAQLPIANQNLEIFLLSSEWERYFFARTRYGAYAETNMWHEKIFINRPDVSTNLAMSKANQYNTRSLASVIAHEGIHIHIWRQFGIRSFLIPNWKKEGYCEYVAQETSIPIKDGLELLRRHSKSDTDALEYFKYFTSAKYLIDIKGVSMTDYFSSSTVKPELTESVWSAAFPYENNARKK